MLGAEAFLILISYGINLGWDRVSLFLGVLGVLGGLFLSFSDSDKFGMGPGISFSRCSRCP
ncbi:MAG: hypothetical protein COT85_05000, partial [Chlamydiae bacterium CG10_big_fil_rev_8_21_14_0_10_42_34]